MRAKKCVSILVAASLATTMLTACPWEKEEDKTDDASSVPVTSTDTSQDDDDDDSTPPEKPSLTITNNGSTITAGGSTTIQTQNGSYALTLNQSGDTLTITPTPSEKHTTTAVTAEVTSTSQGNLSASWKKDEGATRARTLSVRADTNLKLTPDNETNPTKFTLTGIPTDATSCTINVTFEDLGYVIEGDTYKVHDAKGLKAFADAVNDGNHSLNCTLTADITLDSGANWIPIGSYPSNGYAGIFDGAGHTISNLNIKTPSSDCVGLFGYVDGGMVKNLNLTNVSVSGDACVGGVVGYNSGTIQSCMVSGSVSGNDQVGGVVGYNASGSNVEGCCFADGSVRASGVNGAWVGGVVGANSGTVEGCCFAGGRVSGDSDAYVGGVVGFNPGTITDCYWQEGTDGPSQGVGSGNDGTTKVEGSNWSQYEDDLKQYDIAIGSDGKPVPSVIAENNTPEVSGLTQKVLDAARVFWP